MLCVLYGDIQFYVFGTINEWYVVFYSVQVYSFYSYADELISRSY